MTGQVHWRGARWMYKLLPKSKNQWESPILKQSILIGRILPEKTPYEKAARFNPQVLIKEDKTLEVRVPYFVYDDFYKSFFEHTWDFSAEDPTGKLDLKSGDTVLIQRLKDAPDTSESLSLRELAENRWWEDKGDQKEWWEDTKPIQKPVTHNVIEKIYSLGDVKDPITGKMVVGEHYRDHIERTGKLYGEVEDTNNEKFNYSRAPRRGWQEGKRDFTARKTYKKWHVFKKDDKYGLIN